VADQACPKSVAVVTQADMEEAYITNSATVATGFTDRAATACATHLGPATWPEVLRQFAVAAGDE
jgi:hypothetical protein